jgi:hypothetical protein
MTDTLSLATIRELERAAAKYWLDDPVVATECQGLEGVAVKFIINSSAALDLGMSKKRLAEVRISGCGNEDCGCPLYFGEAKR